MRTSRTRACAPPASARPAMGADGGCDARHGGGGPGCAGVGPAPEVKRRHLSHMSAGLRLAGVGQAPERAGGRHAHGRLGCAGIGPAPEVKRRHLSHVSGGLGRAGVGPAGDLADSRRDARHGGGGLGCAGGRRAAHRDDGGGRTREGDDEAMPVGDIVHKRIEVGAERAELDEVAACGGRRRYRQRADASRGLDVEREIGAGAAGAEVVGERERTVVVEGEHGAAAPPDPGDDFVVRAEADLAVEYGADDAARRQGKERAAAAVAGPEQRKHVELKPGRVEVREHELRPLHGGGGLGRAGGGRAAHVAHVLGHAVVENESEVAGVAEEPGDHRNAVVRRPEIGLDRVGEGVVAVAGAFQRDGRAVAADEADGLVVGLKRGGELGPGVDRVGGLRRGKSHPDAVADALDVAQIGDAPAFDEGRIDQRGASPAAFGGEATKPDDLPRHAPARLVCALPLRCLRVRRPTAAPLAG